MKAIALKINRFIFRLPAALPLLNFNLIFKIYSDQCEFICNIYNRCSAVLVLTFTSSSIGPGWISSQEGWLFQNETIHVNDNFLHPETRLIPRKRCLGSRVNVVSVDIQNTDFKSRLKRCLLDVILAQIFRASCKHLAKLLPTFGEISRWLATVASRADVNRFMSVKKAVFCHLSFDLLSPLQKS